MARLFRKDIEPYCAYCRRGSAIQKNEVLCSKRGVVRENYHCSAFCYDPLRRVPPRKAVLNTSKLKPEDFLL